MFWLAEFSVKNILTGGGQSTYLYVPNVLFIYFLNKDGEKMNIIGVDIESNLLELYV